MNAFSLASQQLRSAWRAGEVRLLLLAVVLAVAAMSAVGFFADRIQSALVRQGAVLLGGDMLLGADHPLPASYAQEALRRGLRLTQTLEFPSMVMHGEESQLVEVKAVSAGYPLRGQLTVSAQPYAPAQVAQGIPAAGEVWIEPRLASLLRLEVGDQLALGEREFKVAAILRQEAARGGDLFSIAPRLLMNAADVPGTGLIQFGSRIKYAWLFAGQAPAVDAFADWARARLERGERVQDVRDARPEVRNALQKTQQFLGLAAVASVMLAMVAMSLAGLRFVQLRLDACALMRCFGASQSLILRVFLYQALLLGVLGSLLGCLIGLAAQEVLARLVGSLFLEALPPPTPWPAVTGLLAGVSALLGVMLPHLLRLRGVPALRILRRDLDASSRLAWLAWLPAFAILLGLVFWNARDTELGWIVLGGLCALLLAAVLCAWAAGGLLRSMSGRMGGAWRLGFANLIARPALGVAQVAGFSLALTAMLLLTIVRGDLLQSWRASLPEDAPNRFVINIQQQQLPALQAFFAANQAPAPATFPMVRGRLVAINDAPLDSARYAEGRARRLAEREFNLSWAAHMQADNRIVGGRWWRPDEHGQPLISVEQGIAEALGLKLGDRLAYDIAGNRIELKVQSLRKVEWDSMRANFFVVAAPGVLEAFPASYITSFHLATGQETLLNRLVARFPNLTIIDVAAILEQVRGIMERMAYTVQFVFAFSLLAAVAVLHAALVATQDERLRESALLRVLGASRRQVLAAVMAEFACVGLLAGALAAVAASLLGWVISERLMHLPYSFNWQLALTALLAGGLLAPAAAWLGLRGILRQPPRTVLHST